MFAAGILPFLMPGFAQSASPASGNGPFVVPRSKAYDDLNRVAKEIRADNQDTFSGNTVVIYDQQASGALAMYSSSVRHIKDLMKRMCEITKPPTEVSAEAASDVLSEAGTAAYGLGALIGAVTPAFAVQGQAFTIDNNALIAAFVKMVGLSGCGASLPFGGLSIRHAELR